MNPTKDQICTLLRAWIGQRPGLEFGNSGDASAYRSEMRRITRDGRDARELLRAVELSGITADALAAAFPHAYSGRLSLVERNGRPALDYCTGQYWPTEYRRTACAVLASALWTHKREHCMPDGSRQGASDGAMLYRNPAGKGFVSAGDWLRSSFRREYGRRIASRWFD